MEILFILFGALVFMSGVFAGWAIAGRHYNKKLHDALYDFDADRLMFNQWIVERLEQFKQEGK